MLFLRLVNSGESRAAATSKMERFVIIVNGFQPLTIITKRSILDVAAALDPPLVNMAHNETSLIKLNKEDLVRITLDYQGKFNNILDDLKKDISYLKSDLFGQKSDWSKLEADIQVSRNVNSKLSERLLC